MELGKRSEEKERQSFSGLEESEVPLLLGFSLIVVFQFLLERRILSSLLLCWIDFYNVFEDFQFGQYLIHEYLWKQTLVASHFLWEMRFAQK